MALSNINLCFRFDGIAVVGISLLCQAAFMLTIPWWPNLAAMSFSTAASAFFLGGITSGKF